MEAEKCLDQSERHNKEKVEFESAIYTKVHVLTCPAWSFTVTLLFFLFFYFNLVVQHGEDILVFRIRLLSSCLTLKLVS